MFPPVCSLPNGRSAVVLRSPPRAGSSGGTAAEGWETPAQVPGPANRRLLLDCPCTDVRQKMPYEFGKILHNQHSAPPTLDADPPASLTNHVDPHRISCVLFDPSWVCAKPGR